ncbi:serine/threonine protein kinase, partial [Reticulomyxa filosa]
MKQINEEDEVKIEATSLSFGHSCFKKDWVLQSYPQEHIQCYTCLVCKQIANNPMEIGCPQHESMNGTLIGENCLKLFLKNHNNSCPVQPHDNCQYSRSNFARGRIGDLIVMCIRQFEQELKTSNKTKGEEKMPRVIKCAFKGKLKDLNTHLMNKCPFNLISCWFKPFGCNHECFSYNLHDHLIANMKLHFDLVTQLFQSMQQEIQLKDSRIKQMERDYQQKLLKYHRDIKIKKDFNNNNNLSNHEKIIKSLKEKNTKLTQSIQKLKYQYKEEINRSSTLSSAFNFDLFHSSSKLLKTFTGHIKWVSSIDYSTFDDRQFICSGSEDETVRVWDVDNSKQIQSFNKHSDEVYCVKFSPYHYYNYCKNVICSSSEDSTIRFWDFKNNEQLQIFEGHTHGVCGIQYSFFSAGRYLCSGSGDKTIRLWDVETSKSLHVFNGHTNT